jgi:hypothetical protein
MVAATVISALTVIGVTAYFIKRFDEEGTDMFKELIKKEENKEE